MVYTEKAGYDINLSIYVLKIQDNLSNEVFFTPAEILLRCVMPPE